MQILAIETSTELGSCALWLEGRLSEKRCPTGRPHSETLLPLVRELLAEAGVGLRQLDAIAFGVGPGAFTGLRVACGAAQGLAVAADLPVLPVTSLEALALQSGTDKVLALLDARMGEVYAGTYRKNDQHWCLEGDILVTSPVDLSLPADSGWMVCGNAVAAYPVLADRLRASGIECSTGEPLPLASSIAALAVPRFLAGEALDPALAAPLYVRDKVAKTVAERLSEGGKA
jgi:tRNA threonylcarbamoyladenosine biosynthesis protein TsaB